MLSHCAIGKIGFCRLTQLRALSVRLLATLLRNPLLGPVPKVEEKINTQCVYYHNSEAEATGPRRQEHLREQHSKTQYVVLKTAHNGKPNTRVAVTSVTTTQRHLGPYRSTMGGPLPPMNSDSAADGGAGGLIDNKSRSITTEAKKELQNEKQNRNQQQSSASKHTAMTKLPSVICINDMC